MAGSDTIVIVGMSLAGLRAAETLRRDGFAGRVVAVGGEPHLPYDRPPLSKEVLRGEASADDVVLRPIFDVISWLCLSCAQRGACHETANGAGKRITKRNKENR